MPEARFIPALVVMEPEQGRDKYLVPVDPELDSLDAIDDMELRIRHIHVLGPYKSGFAVLLELEPSHTSHGHYRGR